MSSILDIERKKAKTKQQRKAKLQRQQDRETRLSEIDHTRLRSRIDSLLLRKQKSHNGKLNTADDKLLNDLQSDWKYLENKGKLPKPETINDSKPTEIPEKKLGRESIFFDPQWNPLGLAPVSLKIKNIKYDPKVHNHDLSTIKCLDIPLPDTPQPKYYKLKEYSGIIQGPEILRTSTENINLKQPPNNQVTSFLPRVVMTKKRKFEESSTM